MGPVAARLVADVGKLDTLVATETYQPAQLANGAAELLDEIASSKVTGEECPPGVASGGSWADALG